MDPLVKTFAPFNGQDYILVQRVYGKGRCTWCGSEKSARKI